MVRSILIAFACANAVFGAEDVTSLMHQTKHLKLHMAVAQDGEVNFDEEVDDDRKTVMGQHGMVSATHDLATRAGVQMLEKGGTALDAVVAVQLVLGVTEPHRASLLGGGGLMYKMAGEESNFIDFREEAPAAFHPKVFCANATCLKDPSCGCDAGAWDKNERCTGALSAGTPGVPGLILRLAEDGLLTLPLEEIAQPAIKAAEEGFEMYEEMHVNLVLQTENLARDDAAADIYLNADRTGPKVAVGEILKNPLAAETLRTVFSSVEGLQSAYTGEFADKIVKASQNAVNPNTGTHGLLKKKDLKNYRAVRRAPVEWKYTNPDSGMEYKVSGAPMPFSGPLTIKLFFDQYAQLQTRSMCPLRRWGYWMDAQNVGFADRNQYMADADFTRVPVKGLLKESYGKRRFREVFEPSANELEGNDDAALAVPVAAGQFGKKNALIASVENDHGTSHISIVDRHGNVVSCTTTINMAFGSRVAVPGTGLLLNNQLCDFDSVGVDDEGNVKVNAAVGGKRKRRTALGADRETRGSKRPRSSMSPSIVEAPAGAPFKLLAIGAPGGSDIIGGVANVLRRIMTPEFKMEDLQAVTDAPRMIGKNWADRQGLVELALHDQQEPMESLESLGYVMRAAKQYPPYLNGETFSRVESAMISADGEMFAGAADSIRNPGCVAAAPTK